jgi:hypothetical protein
MEPDESHLYQFSTPQSSNTFKRPRRSLQSSTPLSSVSESVSPSPRLSGLGQPNAQVIDHIHALKHLDDHQILLLLQAARNGGQYQRDLWTCVRSCMSRWESLWRGPFVHVNTRKPCLVLLECAVEQSTKHAFRPSILCRVDRLLIHALQHSVVATLHGLVAPLHDLHSVDACTEELRVHILRQGPQVEAILEVA